jgi:hypothetical protein
MCPHISAVSFGDLDVTEITDVGAPSDYDRHTRRRRRCTARHSTRG